MEAGILLVCFFTVVSHPFWIVMHFTDTDGTVYIRDTYFNTVLVYNDWLYVTVPYCSKMTTSGPFADTHSLTKVTCTLHPDKR